MRKILTPSGALRIILGVSLLCAAFAVRHHVPSALVWLAAGSLLLYVSTGEWGRPTLIGRIPHHSKYDGMRPYLYEWTIHPNGGIMLDGRFVPWECVRQLRDALGEGRAINTLWWKAPGKAAANEAVGRLASLGYDVTRWEFEVGAEDVCVTPGLRVYGGHNLDLARAITVHTEEELVRRSAMSSCCTVEGYSVHVDGEGVVSAGCMQFGAAAALGLLQTAVLWRGVHTLSGPIPRRMRVLPGGDILLKGQRFSHGPVLHRVIPKATVVAASEAALCEREFAGGAVLSRRRGETTRPSGYRVHVQLPPTRADCNGLLVGTGCTWFPKEDCLRVAAASLREGNELLPVWDSQRGRYLPPRNCLTLPHLLLAVPSWVAFCLLSPVWDAVRRAVSAPPYPLHGMSLEAWAKGLTPRGVAISAALYSPILLLL